MQIDFTKDGKTELIKISSKPSRLLMILTTIALLLVLQTLTVLMTEKLALALTVLISLNLVCGAWLLVACTEQLLPVKLKLDPDRITCQHLVNSKSYDWDDISEIKLVSAATVTDSPNATDRNNVGIGIGLVLRAARDPKAPQAVKPSIVLVRADPQFAEKMLDIVDRLKTYQAALNAAPQERWKKAQQPQQQAQFRKRPNITMPGSV